MKLRIFLIGVVALIGATTARPEVIDSAPSGFHIKIEAPVKVPPDVAYRAFLDVGQWWDSDHTWFGDSRALSIEPRAGGCFCEKNGDKSVLLMRVSFVNPDKEIRMLGGLGPLQVMGLHGVLSFRFERINDAETRIVHEYRVTGYAPDGLQSLAQTVDRVQTEQVKRLQEYLTATISRDDDP